MGLACRHTHLHVLGVRTVCPGQGQRGTRALQAAASDYDTLHARRPRALQHRRQVWVMIALVLAAIHAAIHIICQVGTNVCGHA